MLSAPWFGELILCEVLAVKNHEPNVYRTTATQRGENRETGVHGENVTTSLNGQRWANEKRLKKYGYTMVLMRSLLVFLRRTHGYQLVCRWWLHLTSEFPLFVYYTLVSVIVAGCNQDVSR